VLPGPVAARIGLGTLVGTRGEGMTVNRASPMVVETGAR
jgi:hypothetical protein